MSPFHSSVLTSCQHSHWRLRGAFLGRVAVRALAGLLCHSSLLSQYLHKPTGHGRPISRLMKLIGSFNGTFAELTPAAWQPLNCSPINRTASSPGEQCQSQMTPTPIPASPTPSSPTSLPKFVFIPDTFSSGVCSTVRHCGVFGRGLYLQRCLVFHAEMYHLTTLVSVTALGLCAIKP